jgi:hypothetical protein
MKIPSKKQVKSKIVKIVKNRCESLNKVEKYFSLPFLPSSTFGITQLFSSGS